MAKDSYCLLLIRKDKPTKRLHISPFFIKITIATFVILILSIVASSYLAYHNYVQVNILTNKLTASHQKILGLKHKLDKQNKVCALAHLLSASLNSTNQTQNRSNSSQLEKKPKSASTPLNLNQILKTIDLKVISIKNVYLKKHKNKFLFHLELNNLLNAVKIKKEKKIKGRIYLSLVLVNAQEKNLNLTDEQLSFEISNFKAIDLPLKFPLPTSQIYALKITIKEQNEKIIFMRAYPLADILVS